MFVKVNDNIVTNYTVSYKHKTITFTTAIIKWTKVNIIMSGNGEMILDIDSFTGDLSIRICNKSDWRTVPVADGEKVNCLETTDSPMIVQTRQ